MSFLLKASTSDVRVASVSGGDSSAGYSNFNAISALLSVGANVAIPGGLGDVYCAQTLLLPSYTTLTVGSGSRLKKIPGVPAYHLVRNLHCHGGAYVNGGLIVNGVFTVNEPGHSHAVGDIVFCENFKGNLTLNGPKTVLFSIPGVSWTFAAAGSDPTNTATEVMFASHYYPISGASFSRVSNLVTVLEPGNLRNTGDSVYINGLTGDTSFNGVYEIVANVAGVSWSYESTGANGSPTGTANVLGDTGIVYTLALDGNFPNLSATSQWGNHLSQWGNVSNVTGVIAEAFEGRAGRAANHYNVRNVNIPIARGKNKTGVLLQFDGVCDQCFVGTATGDLMDDDIVAWGVVNGGAYGDTTPPTMAVFGVGNMGSLNVDVINGYSPTGLYKTYCATGYSAGRVKIGNIQGFGTVAIGDPSTGVSGGGFESIRIDVCENYPADTKSTFLCSQNAWGSIGDISFGKLVDNPFSSATTGAALVVNGPFTSISVDHFIARTVRDNTRVYCSFGPTLANATIKFDKLETTCGPGAFLILGRNPSGTIKVGALYLNNWTHRGAANNAGTLIYSDVGCGFEKVFVNGAYIYGCNAIFSAGTAGATHNLHFVNVYGDVIGSGFTSGVTGTFNINLSNVYFEGVNIANRLLQFATAGQTIRAKIRGLRGMSNGKLFLTGVGTPAYQIDGGPDTPVDLGANGLAPPAVLSVPVAGDQVWNYNAVGTGLYGRTAAGAWQLIY
jgi:hypothetical protein